MKNRVFNLFQNRHTETIQPHKAFALTGMPTTYIIMLHLNNLALTFSRAEVEAAIVLLCADRDSRNAHINAVFSNIINTYGEEELLIAAKMKGHCVLSKTN